MCSQQVENNLSTQVDFVNVDDYEPAFQLIPPFGEYDYKELVKIFIFLLKNKKKKLFCEFLSFLVKVIYCKNENYIA